MTHLQVFSEEVEKYLARTKLKPTAFGVAAVGDPNFVFELRAGREPRIGTIDKVRQFLRDAADDGVAA